MLLNHHCHGFGIEPAAPLAQKEYGGLQAHPAKKPGDVNPALADGFRARSHKKLVERSGAILSLRKSRSGFQARSLRLESRSHKNRTATRRLFRKQD
jgi:hypothetical protein